MFGIISCGKEKLLEKKDSLPNSIFGESFEYGFLSVLPGEEGDSFLLKDDLNKRIIIFEGKLYADNYEINPKSGREMISEVIFSLYLKKGLDFLSCLKGEFILGLWDENAKRFLLARDKLGRRHIYYSVQDGLFVFSSKINNFHNYNFVKKDINLDALNLYFSFKFVPSPHTIFKDIHRLPSAHTLVWENGSLSSKRYWEVNIDRTGEKRKLEYDILEVEKLIENAIKRRVSRHKNICSYLSGGIDTSIIVGILSSSQQKNLSAFCAKDKNISEDVKYARLVAKHFKINNYHEKAIACLDTIKYLPEVIQTLEDLIVQPTGLYIYLINKLAKNHGDIILSGEGADLLFGGHRYYYLLDLVNKLSSLYPKKIFGGISKLNLQPSFKYRLLSLRDSKSRERSFLDLAGVFSKEDKERMLTDKVKNNLREDLEIEILKPYFNKSSTFIDLLMKFGLENTIPDMFLLKDDKLARANSIEYSAIFLDEDLVEYAFTISRSNIFNIMNRKIILKKVLERLGVPRGVIYRKKIPFVVPTREWLKGDLNKWMRGLLSYKNISSQGFFNFPQIEKIFKFADNDLRAQWQLWSLAIFTLWFQIFISNEDIS